MGEIYIDKHKCVSCKKCVSDCPSLSIDIHNYSVDTYCIKCGHCVAICPEGAIRFAEGEVVALQQEKIDSKAMYSFFANNRTIRKFLEKEIEKSDIDFLIDAMKHYGSATNRREVEISIIANREKVNELDAFVANDLTAMFKQLSNPFVSFFVSMFYGKEDAGKIKHYNNSFIRKNELRENYICYNAPLVLIFHGSASKISMNEADSAIWAANTVTLAGTKGISHCYNGYIKTSLNRHKKARANYGIPSGHVVYSALLLGYSNITYKNECGRKPPKATYL